jgi:hypothetical protein
MSDILRFDIAEMLPPREMPDGTLLADGLVAKPGVMIYRNSDGSLRRELVLPEELHDQESLESLKRVTLTLGHPPGGVINPDHVTTFSVGDNGERVEVMADGHVKVDMAIRARRALRAVREDGVRGLSLGYKLSSLELTSGTHPEYGAYDAIQRGRRYNHNAIVRAGRAGPTVQLRADSQDAEMVLEGDVKQPAPAPPIYREDHSMKTLIERIKAALADDTLRADAAGLRNLLTEAELVLISDEGTLTAANSRADTAEGALAAAKSAGDLTAGKLAALETKVAADEQARTDSAETDEQRLAWFGERSDLLALAKKHRCDEAEVATLDNAGLRRAIVKTHVADLREDASDDYIAGVMSFLSSDKAPAPKDERYQTFRVDAKPNSNDRNDDADKPLSVDPHSEMAAQAFKDAKPKSS